jgi:hypothetical protein
MRCGIALFFGVSLMSLAPVAAACSCQPPPPPAAAAGESAAVFIGTVVSTRPSWSGRRPSEAEFDSAHRVVTLRVAARWRGAAGATVIVRTDWARCGSPLEVGETYVVYAYLARGQLWTNLCTRTTELSGAAYDLGGLGRPRSGAIPRGAPQPEQQLEIF